MEERVLTKEHLTDEYKNKIRKELEKALVYFGEWDKDRMSKTIEKKILKK